MTSLDNITRFHIAESIHNEFGLPKKDCIDFVSDIIDIVIEGLKNSDKVKIHNFGTFIVRHIVLSKRFLDSIHFFLSLSKVILLLHMCFQ